MKKVLSIIIAMSFLFTSYAQKVDSLTNLSDTNKLTLGKVYSDVKAGINGLAQSLKVPATHVYSIMIRQQIAQSISDLIFVVVFIILSIVLYKAGMRTMKKIEATKETDELIGITIFTFVLCGISTIITVCSFWHDYSSIVTGFTNPEYGAIKEIISFVK